MLDARIRDEIELIKESILQAVAAEAIYLFGSYAYGTPGEDSDLDIYVVVPDDAADLSEVYGDIMSQIWGERSKELDLLIGRSSIFNRRKNGPTLEGVVARKGELLYGA